MISISHERYEDRFLNLNHSSKLCYVVNQCKEPSYKDSIVNVTHLSYWFKNYNHVSIGHLRKIDICLGSHVRLPSKDDNNNGSSQNTKTK